ncbi:hypothetical protein KC221_26345, partial [Mycobacterium tuberculosis]|nr:hypothetical protein [Mycobacterium tuberculosis]
PPRPARRGGPRSRSPWARGGPTSPAVRRTRRAGPAGRRLSGHLAPAGDAINWLLELSLVAWGVAVMLLARGVRQPTPAFTVLGAA